MANFVQLDSTERVRGELLLRLETKDDKMIGHTRSENIALKMRVS